MLSTTLALHVTVLHQQKPGVLGEIFYRRLAHFDNDVPRRDRRLGFIGRSTLAHRSDHDAVLIFALSVPTVTVTGEFSFETVMRS